MKTYFRKAGLVSVYTAIVVFAGAMATAAQAIPSALPEHLFLAVVIAPGYEWLPECVRSASAESMPRIRGAPDSGSPVLPETTIEHTIHHPETG